jgi:hypothetical protein
MKKLATLIALLCFGVSYAQQYSKVKIYADSEGLQRLAELGVPVDHGIQKRNTFLISDFSTQEIETIANNGFMFDIMIEDVKEFYRNQNLNPVVPQKNTTCNQSGGGGAFSPSVPVNFETSAGSYAGFYTYQQMLDALDYIAT